jgi:hypothetical protein
MNLNSDNIDDSALLLYYQQVMSVIARYDLFQTVFWDSRIKFFVNCNEMFGNVADSEPLISLNDIVLLEASVLDCEMALQNSGQVYGPMLYCNRKRQRNIQKKKTKFIPKELKFLFTQFDN